MKNDFDRYVGLYSVAAAVDTDYPTISKTYAYSVYDSESMFVNESNPLKYGEDSTQQEQMCLSFERISIEILSDKVKSFDVSAGNGSYFV